MLHFLRFTDVTIQLEHVTHVIHPSGRGALVHLVGGTQVLLKEPEADYLAAAMGAIDCRAGIDREHLSNNTTA